MILYTRSLRLQPAVSTSLITSTGKRADYTLPSKQQDTFSISKVICTYLLQTITSYYLQLQICTYIFHVYSPVPDLSALNHKHMLLLNVFYFL